MALLGEGREWSFGVTVFSLQGGELFEAGVDIFNSLTRLSWKWLTFLSCCWAGWG